MKKLYTSVLILFIVVSFSAKKITINTSENELIATFKGLTNNDYYKFTNDKNVEYVFYDLAQDIEIGLYDDDFIGKKFSITWKEKQIDVLDKEGDETGEKTTVKSILTLKLIK